MARLAAIAKTLYYPTQDRVVDLLKENIQVSINGEGFLLDPCCGKGLAAKTLSQTWGLKSVGIELDVERFEESKSHLDECFLGSIHQAKVKKGGASVLFLNPPYDWGDHGRQELEFLRVSTKLLIPGGLLIFVVPISIFKNKDTESFLKNEFRNIRIWKYPEPEFSEFKQVVILATRNTPRPSWQNSRYYSYYNYFRFPEEEDLQVLGETDKEEISLVPSILTLSMRTLNPLALKPSKEEGVYGSFQWDLLVNNKGSTDITNPLMPPRNGHRAMMLVSGYLNGLEISGKLIKGKSVKTSFTIENEDETIQRERIDSLISELDLKTRTFDSWNAKDNEARTIEWFEKNGSQLSEAVSSAYTPQWGGDLSNIDFSSFTAPGVLPGRKEPEFLEVQKQAAAAISFRWKTYKSVILCGEQGIGKTSIAAVNCGLHSKRKKNIIICPSHLVPKWLRETRRIFGDSEISMKAEKISDIEKFFSYQDSLERFLLGKTEPRFLVMSKEKAKLGSKWKSAFKRVKKRVPKTKDFIEFVGCPSCGGVTYLAMEDMDKTKQSCPSCKKPMWQCTPLSGKGTLRWALAQYINKHHAGRYNLILDETHAFAKAETDQSKAVQLLCSGAEKILAMTGTLYGGRASSLFHLLYKIDPTFRQMYGFTEARKFSETHGLFETVFKEEEKTSRYGYKKGNSGGRLKEIPGVSPTMINLLLHFTIFVKLKDLGIQLPEYKETVRFLDPDPEVSSWVTTMQNSVKSMLRKHPSLIGSFLMSSLGYIDAPEGGDSIVLQEGEGKSTEVFSLPSLPRDSLPKDLELLEIVKENHSKGRKVMVYFTQTKKRNPIPRVKRFLEDHGFIVEHMPSSVDPTKREAWVKKACERGFDVFLTNGRLVETGLDLLFAHTIVQYGIEYSINSLRQSIRRSWRLGQDKPIEVIFLAYNGTQKEAMNLISRKMRAAELLDGEDEFSGLSQSDESSTDFLLELAQKIMRGDL